MSTIDTGHETPHLAACVAPEDLNCGDYVAALNVICELPSFLWCCDCTGMQPDEPVRVRFRSSSGTPLKIKSICLPFLFVKLPKGTVQIMDVRQTQFVRLNSDYAAKVWKELKA